VKHNSQLLLPNRICAVEHASILDIATYMVIGTHHKIMLQCSYKLASVRYYSYAQKNKKACMVFLMYFSATADNVAK